MTHTPTTPEDLFILPTGPLPEFPIDALNCTLSRAASVVFLLSADGSDINSGFSLNHRSVMDAIWCLDGLIQQAKLITNCQHK